MADEDGKHGDLKYYQNQPYDMEVDLNNDDDEGENINPKKKEAKNDNEEDQQEEQNFQEIMVFGDFSINKQGAAGHHTKVTKGPTI